MMTSSMLLLALQATVGPTLTSIVHGGRGVAVDCGGTYPMGVGMRLSAPIFHLHGMTLQLSGSDHWIGGGACGALRPPPADGTRVEGDKHPLLGQPFVMTDVRLARAFDRDIVSLSLGAGNAWRRGHNLPYLVIGGTADAPSTGRVRLGVTLEYQLLRVTSDRFQRTYQGGQLMSETALGQVHVVGNALALGVHVEWPL